VEVEEPLAGGNFGVVVRVGDTVRRETGPWTPAVHALLRHLEAAGFEAAPRVLGIDERGREILSFVEGEVPWPPPAWLWADDATASLVGALTRRYHDAQDGFVPPPDARWRIGAASGEVICHHDIAPWNVVYRAGEPVALIDWDFAGPGTRLWDLAYAAWRYGPLYAPRAGDESPDVERSARRLRLLCDGYGLDRRDALLETVVARMQAMHDLLVAGRDAATTRLVAEGHHRAALEDAAWVTAQAARLAAEL
jgi:Ser/Thr protein kinase RdoA (MazF antagonist)